MSKVAKAVGAVVVGIAALVLGPAGYPLLAVKLMTLSNTSLRVRDRAGTVWVAGSDE